MRHKQGSNDWDGKILYRQLKRPVQPDPRRSRNETWYILGRQFYTIGERFLVDLGIWGSAY
jgi:hypothetical protein